MIACFLTCKFYFALANNLVLLHTVIFTRTLKLYSALYHASNNRTFGKARIDMHHIESQFNLFHFIHVSLQGRVFQYNTQANLTKNLPISRPNNLHLSKPFEIILFHIKLVLRHKSKHTMYHEKQTCYSYFLVTETSKSIKKYKSTIFCSDNCKVTVIKLLQYPQ